MTIARKKISPLFKQSLSIQSLDNYHDLLRKKYKEIRNYRFKPSPETILRGDTKKSLERIFQVLRHTKAIKKIDFSPFLMADYPPNSSIRLAIIKRVRRTESISVYRSYSNTDLHRLNNSPGKWFRSLVGIQNLVQNLEYSFGLGYNLQESKISKEIKSLLRNLKSCPKIRAIAIKTKNGIKEYSVCFYDFQKYPSKLKRLTLEPKLATEESNSSIEHLKNLESIQLHFDLDKCPKSALRALTDLSNLNQLQEVNLTFEGKISEVHSALTKVAQRGMLKKLALNIKNDSVEVLKAFAGVHLGTFTFKASISNDEQLLTISNFLQGLHQLEDLQLEISHYFHFKKASYLELICLSISKLQTLRSLRLTFKALGRFFEKDRLPNFLPSLEKVFSKPIKLCTFSFTCNQVDTPRFLFSIIGIIKPITSFLRELEIDLGSYSPDKKSHEAISKFISRLQSIKVLKLLCFDISPKKFLIDIVQALCDLKNLRVLALQNFIKGSINAQLFLESLETILKKEGLVSFEYHLDQTFLGIFRGKKKFPVLNLKQITKTNPSLENAVRYGWLFDHNSLPRSW